MTGDDREPLGRASRKASAVGPEHLRAALVRVSSAHDNAAVALDNLSEDRSTKRAFTERAPRLPHWREQSIGDQPGVDTTPMGRAVSDAGLPRLILFLKQYSPNGAERTKLWRVLVRIEPDMLASAILCGAIRVTNVEYDYEKLDDGEDELDDGEGDGNKRPLQAAAYAIGNNIYGECLHAGILDRRTTEWDAKQISRVGFFGIDALTQALPDLFELTRRPGDPRAMHFLRATQKAFDIFDTTLAKVVVGDPYFTPSTEPLEPWRTDTRIIGGRRQRFMLRRGKSASTIRKAVRAGRMDAALAAVNHLEDTAWSINEPMLNFVIAAEKTGFPKIFDDEQDPAALRAGRNVFKRDKEIANHLRGVPSFWMPKSCDFRGRVYSMPKFNYARDDHVRALFQFAKGKPLGEGGLRQLKIHICNLASGAGHRPGNLTLDQRLIWVDGNSWRPGKRNEIIELGRDVFEGRDVSNNALLRDVDKPFQFAAACVEFYGAHQKGPSFNSRLPVSLDASCSGLQIISALTRAEKEAHLVNLTPDPVPRDIYQDVLLTLGRLIAQDDLARPIPDNANFDLVEVLNPLSDATGRAAAEKLNADGVKCPGGHSWDAKLVTKFRKSLRWAFDRKCALFLSPPGMMTRRHSKPRVMTYFYGASSLGMADQLNKDTNWFPEVRRYFVRKIREAIKHDAPVCAQVLRFLQKIERLLASENKFLRHTLPDGFPFENRYHHPNVEPMTTWIRGRRRSVNVTIGDLPTIRSNKAVTSVSPNLTHALDGYHVRSTALAAREAGIALETVHDCVVCLAADAERIRDIALDCFAKIYESRDILAEILEQARKELTPAKRRKLPILPTYGTLNISDVRKSKYAIS